MFWLALLAVAAVIGLVVGLVDNYARDREAPIAPQRGRAYLDEIVIDPRPQPPGDYEFVGDVAHDEIVEEPDDIPPHLRTTGAPDAVAFNRFVARLTEGRPAPTNAPLPYLPPSGLRRYLPRGK